jgi:hypothetical protein
MTETNTHITYDRFDNDIINKINEYNVESTYIVKKITDDENNLIELKIDNKLQKWINSQTNKDNLLPYLTKYNFVFTLNEIKLSHYRSESDEILINSHGDFGLKLEIKYKDYIICEKTLCMDDFNFASKEIIIENIKNNLENLQQNYIYLLSYIYNELKPTQKQSSIKIISPIPNPSSIPISQTAGNIF